MPRITVKPPESLNKSTDYKTYRRWIPLFKNYATQTKLAHLPAAEQIAVLKSMMDPGLLYFCRAAPT